MTPASSNSEETHNTLKFAHRSKRVEIKASQNKVNLIFTFYVKYYQLKLNTGSYFNFSSPPSLSFLDYR